MSRHVRVLYEQTINCVQSRHFHRRPSLVVGLLLMVRRYRAFLLLPERWWKNSDSKLIFTTQCSSRKWREQFYIMLSFCTSQRLPPSLCVYLLFPGGDSVVSLKSKPAFQQNSLLLFLLLHHCALTAAVVVAVIIMKPPKYFILCIFNQHHVSVNCKIYAGVARECRLVSVMVPGWL